MTLTETLVSTRFAVVESGVAVARSVGGGVAAFIVHDRGEYARGVPDSDSPRLQDRLRDAQIGAGHGGAAREHGHLDEEDPEERYQSRRSAHAVQRFRLHYSADSMCGSARRRTDSGLLGRDGRQEDGLTQNQSRFRN